MNTPFMLAITSVAIGLSATALRASNDEVLPSHDPGHAAEQLVVHPQLQVKLFASEPMLTNPASIDVDHLGRVWVCEVVNYRAFRNADIIGNDPAPDRILVLEDTSGDGVADKSTVFYQGHDVDSAHGILILGTPDGKGTRAVVSAGDSVFFLIDDDGDLKADRKELLFTGIKGTQHDHGIHAVHFGPDGKFYFTFGNEGVRILDKDGHPIIDQAGNEVNNSRRPYQEGMVFRCNPDGSEFETLAWNFRNNWELCVDSFGTIWQSDNDDDGNQGTRVNYVMEYGNYGYKDELTGASWRTPRTNWEDEIPQRHWHLNDPGVIPNLLQTGAGAPSGICVYEGNLLPEQFRGAIIHCDAGLGVCRAYVTRPVGAGYSAQIVNILNGSQNNNWFRPSDVCVAPDGSLFVADWYDAGVGGHRMVDIKHGRIFRVTPRGQSGEYRVPPVKVSTPEGIAKALASPNMATRYLAFMASRNNPQSLLGIKNLWEADDPRLKARALWIIAGSVNPQQLSYLRQALNDPNPDLRVTGLRILRQTIPKQIVLSADVEDTIYLDDPSPAFRREELIAMREFDPDWVPPDKKEEFIASAWTKLTRPYDGSDRWYLEALGIAADHRWDTCLDDWLKFMGNRWKTTKAGRDIVWRSRAARTPELLAEIIAEPATPETEIPRFLRALDFVPAEHLNETLHQLALLKLPQQEDRVRFVRIEALNRMQQDDLKANPQLLEAVEQALADCRGSRQFLQLVARFHLTDHYPELLEMALTTSDPQLAAESIRALYSRGQDGLINQELVSDDRERIEHTLSALAVAGHARSIPPLLELIRDQNRPLWLRRDAVKSLAASSRGADELLQLAQAGDYDEQLKQTLAAALTSTMWAPIQEAASELFPAPAGKDATPLPSISELSSRTGNAERGRIVFHTTGTCNKCHQVNGIGTEIGPNLSEIGSKLTRPALYEAILYPSAGISHNYESWVVLTDDGQIQLGLLVSENDQEVTLKDDKGITRTIPTSSIEERRKQDISLMPADLQKLTTTKELVDLVEYLTTLKERADVVDRAANQ